MITLLLHDMAIAKEEVYLTAHIHDRSDLTIAIEKHRLEIKFTNDIAIRFLTYNNK